MRAICIECGKRVPLDIITDDDICFRCATENEHANNIKLHMDRAKTLQELPSCPHCGEDDMTLEKGDTFLYCNECQHSFTIEDMELDDDQVDNYLGRKHLYFKAMAEKWQKVFLSMRGF